MSSTVADPAGEGAPSAAPPAAKAPSTTLPAPGRREFLAHPVPWILVRNRSAFEGVGSWPSAPSSAAERPSKGIATRPNTSRS